MGETSYVPESSQETLEVEEYCGRCSTRLVPRANFCHHCGAQVLRPNTQVIVPPQPAEPARRPPAEAEEEPAPELDETHDAASSGDEELVWEGRPSAKAVIAGAVRGLLIGAAVVGSLHWVLARTEQAPLKVEYEVAAWCIIAAAFTLRPLLTMLGQKYTVTSRSIWVQEGTIRKVTTRHRLSDWKHIHCQQSLLQRLLGTGDIELEPAVPWEPPVVLKDVDKPSEVALLIDRALTAAQQKRSLRRRPPSRVG